MTDNVDSLKVNICAHIYKETSDIFPKTPMSYEFPSSIHRQFEQEDPLILAAAVVNIGIVVLRSHGRPTG